MAIAKIISKKFERFCVALEIQINGKRITIKFGLHAIERIKLWQLEENEVVNAMIFPDEVVIGHGKRFIAHKLKDPKIVRVIYEYREKIPFVITVYAPSKERYFQGGKIYADKIFP